MVPINKADDFIGILIQLLMMWLCVIPVKRLNFFLIRIKKKNCH